MNNTNQFLDEISKLQNDFYAKTSKNTLFKTKQKLECAAAVSDSMDINELTAKTFYIIPNTNRIFLDYTIFKLYANPNNYNYLVDWAVSLIMHCIHTHGSFDVHVNINTFTITACQKYKTIIEMFMDACFQTDSEAVLKLGHLYIYNIPSVFDSIIKFLNPFINDTVKPKIVVYDKTQSPALIQKLFM